MPDFPDSEPDPVNFRRDLTKSVITGPLLDRVQNAADEVMPVIIDINLDYAGGRRAARDKIAELVEQAIVAVGDPDARQGIRKFMDPPSHPYIFADLQGKVVQELVRRDRASATPATGGDPQPALRAIYRIWEDTVVKALTGSGSALATIKADAAHAAFSARGTGLIWAVMDSGIDGQHPHFQKWSNLNIPAPIQHCDYNSIGGNAATALQDPFGHGTHVAGIIAGEASDQNYTAISKVRDETGAILYRELDVKGFCGVAPECKLVSMRVLNDKGMGLVSSILSAIDTVQKLNDNGRRILIHGVNLSVGYDFNPEWFACGQSPLCVEVNRLVRSGVAVVVAAGNTGYGTQQSMDRGGVAGGLLMSINDPGNAELAITVGSTHRDMPHVYGVSYFSSKGPTGDGRLKPDLVAPGEKILSCATGAMRDKILAKSQLTQCDYVEDSGTSMAAPHVSGAIAAFLSVRREFIGSPEDVKRVFVDNATDLRRERWFQGRGLVDVMRALQAV